MIPGVNIVSVKASIASVNGVVVSGECSESLSRGFRGHSPPRTLLGSKEHLDWLKIDLNAVEIIIVQDYT